MQVIRSRMRIRVKKVTQFQEETEIILPVVELAIRIREGLKIVTKILKKIEINRELKKKKCMYSSASSIVNKKRELEARINESQQTS